MKKICLLVVLLSASLCLAYMTFRNSSVTAAVTVQPKLTIVRGYYIYNPNATICSLDLFNATSGSVTLGSTVPQNSFVVPPTSAVALSDLSLNYPAALSVAAVTAAGGGTTCATGMVVNLFYQ